MTRLRSVLAAVALSTAAVAPMTVIAPAANAATAPASHTVKRGETLAGIAAMYRIKGGWKTLAAWNNLPDPNTIRVGQKLTLTAPKATGKLLPATMKSTGGGTQLITVTAASLKSTTGTLTWWTKSGKVWKQAGTAPARFGANGLADGATRKQGTWTTPTGLFGMPFAFGTKPAPKGTSLPYKKVTNASWWCQDNKSTSLNRWVAPLPKDCRASEAEHLADYTGQYAHAVVIDYNYAKPVKHRGAGIFLHVNGRGATAGCVSVPAAAMAKLTAWLKPNATPHIAIGTTSGTTAITRY
ncbi:LysM peptidoglycan-binding domain-containing protein [Streptomyces sp. N35]|uniref:LysM peptidoglycan-binding domain-containing protein n=1 Tax=Streptomyces sp. N35 TaxID=2795730 RepID=UPI0018F44FF6|nr:LysM peptidoglycan-binding domain-containing protein [Streptomyces sp. N35]